VFCYLRKKVGFPRLFRGLLWLSPTVLTVLLLSCFAGLLLVSDDHVHPAGVSNVGECWTLLQTSAGGVFGQGHHYCNRISLCFSAAIYNSQPRKNMLGYSPRLRLHLSWLISSLINNKTFML
jgi:hypothetical protein